MLDEDDSPRHNDLTIIVRERTDMKESPTHRIGKRSGKPEWWFCSKMTINIDINRDLSGTNTWLSRYKYFFFHHKDDFM